MHRLFGHVEHHPNADPPYVVVVQRVNGERIFYGCASLDYAQVKLPSALSAWAEIDARDLALQTGRLARVKDQN